MKRRTVIALLGGAAAAASRLAARAQSPSRMRRIGIFLTGRVVPARDLAIVNELEKLGYVEGRDVVYTIRGSDNDPALALQTARQLVAANPEVIVGPGTTIAYALADATRDIPIVLTAVPDPVAGNLTDSLSHPSRNVTGFTLSSTTITAKRLQILRELVPTLRKAGYIWAPNTQLAPAMREQAEQAARLLGIELVALPLKSESDIAAAFDTTDREHLDAVVAEADELTFASGAAIADQCLVRDLPLMHGFPTEVRNGALIGYGPAEVENFKGAARYVDKILKGAKVAELPFEEPTQIILAINLKVAKQIGLKVPPNLLARADEVVE